MNNIYNRASGGKESLYVTNKSLQEMLTIQNFPESNVVVEKSIAVITAIATGDDLGSSSISTYSYRPRNTPSHYYDLFSTTVSFSTAKEEMMSVVDKFKAKLVIMDLNGGIENEDTKQLVDECDVTLLVFSPIADEIRRVAEYYSSLTADEKVRVKLICNKWVDSSDKKVLQEALKLKATSIFFFPYNGNITRAMYESRAEILTPLIIKGQDMCLNIRAPLKEILSFICDTPKSKVIREVSKW